MSKFNKPYDRTVHRLREIEPIIKHRYGVLPDTDDVDIVLNQVACCQLQMRRKKLGQLSNRARDADRSDYGPKPNRRLICQNPKLSAQVS